MEETFLKMIVKTMGTPTCSWTALPVVREGQVAEDSDTEDGGAPMSAARSPNKAE